MVKLLLLMRLLATHCRILCMKPILWSDTDMVFHPSLGALFTLCAVIGGFIPNSLITQAFGLFKDFDSLIE